MADKDNDIIDSLITLGAIGSAVAYTAIKEPGVISGLLESFGKSLDESQKKKIEKKLKLRQEFENIEPENRKFLYISDDKTCCEKTENIFYMGKDFLSGVEFLDGAPKFGCMYLVHKLKPMVYVPLEGYEITMFHDKIQEFSWFCQCLGAKEITLMKFNGEEVFFHNNSTSNMSGKLGMAGFGTKASGQTISDNTDYSYNGQFYQVRQTFKDMKRNPELAKDLVWYNYDESWKNLFKQRINGMMSYSITMSSENIKYTSSLEESNILAELKAWFIKAKGSFSEHIESQFNKSESVRLNYSIDFYDFDL